MDTCVRGFSFMTESKTELQYIEGGELERTWRSTRRERMKKREQNIWDSFVKEKDAVKGVCTDDPYQFLDPLPESCMKEMLEDEQPKLTREITEEEIRAKMQNQKPAQHSSGNNSLAEETQHTCVVTFAEDIDKEEREMFYIFEDDQSGGEDEALNESNGPDTVREVPPESVTTSAGEQPPQKDIELQKSSSKSSENVASVIENSIYCARVKELRAKINEELLDLMTSLDRRDILLSSEPEDIARMVKRSAEFCSRFNRIYMYQLQRQIHDIKRNNTQSLPFAKHTQFQSQMGRIVSLHQNLLQSFMVFHKSFSQTCCVRESAGALGSLLAAVRDATHMCGGVPAPRDFSGCQDLYKDDLLSTCDKVDEFVNEYAIRCEEFLNRFETDNTATTKKTKKETKPKKKAWNNKSSIKSGTESQLSMYSMSDNLHLNRAKSSSSHKEGQSGSSSKMRVAGGTGTAYLKKGTTEKKTGSTPRRYRPLMRDPHEGRPRAPKRTRDPDIRTMVEAVETCASSHISCEDSPPACARAPRRLPPVRAPPAPRPPRVPRAPCRQPPSINIPQLQLSLRTNTHEPGQKKSQPSPRPARYTPRSNEVSTAKSRPLPPTPKSTIPLKDTSSSSRTERETEEQELPIPVLSVKCAVKQDSKEEEVKQESSRKESPHGEHEHRNEKNKASTDPSMMKLVYEYGECSTTVQKYVSPRNPRAHTKNRVTSPTEREHAQDYGSPDRSEVTRLLKQLCSGDGSGCRTERVTGSKNVQLVQISGMSPRQPSTPQLLKILEETIKKKVPKPLFHKPVPTRSPDSYRLQFNIGEKAADALFQYRTKFVQHMLTSAMYANSAVGKPWEMIGNVSENIIDELLVSCLSKMELREMIEELFRVETC